MKIRVIPCPHRPLTRCDTTVSVAKVVVSPMVPPPAFAKGRSMKTNRTKVPF